MRKTVNKELMDEGGRRHKCVMELERINDYLSKLLEKTKAFDDKSVIFVLLEKNRKLKELLAIQVEEIHSMLNQRLSEAELKEELKGC